MEDSRSTKVAGWLAGAIRRTRLTGTEPDARAALQVPTIVKPQPVLLVEDDPSTLMGLVELLTSQGYPVRSAQNGAEAVDLLSEGLRPAVILLDLTLPKVSGWEFLNYLRRDGELREIPVIVVTALSQQEAHVIGADLVLQKPVNLSELLAAVKRLI
jgi:two-component system sensor histidine kinase ChiS